MSYSSYVNKLSSGRDQFFQWAELAQTNGHFTQGNVTRMKGAFNNRFQNFPDPATCISAKDGFITWTKKAEAEKHITQGNVNWIIKKIDQFIPDQLLLDWKTASSTPTPLKQASSTDYKVDNTLWNLLKTKMAPFHQFLTDKNFVYDVKKYYDFGIEDVFGVFWIDEKTDAQFIKKFQQKFNDKALDTGARFANNDVVSYLVDKKSHEKIRYILTYCMSKLTPKELALALSFAKTRQ